jgi:hypothetical protein
VFIGAEISGLGAASMLRLMHSARIPLEFAPGAILSLAGKIENGDKQSDGEKGLVLTISLYICNQPWIFNSIKQQPFSLWLSRVILQPFPGSHLNMGQYGWRQV